MSTALSKADCACSGLFWEACELASLASFRACSADCWDSLAVGPLGYNGSKAAMELIAKADVVLALGTRLNPFST